MKRCAPRETALRYYDSLCRCAMPCNMPGKKRKPIEVHHDPSAVSAMLNADQTTADFAELFKKQRIDGAVAKQMSFHEIQNLVGVFGAAKKIHGMFQNEDWAMPNLPDSPPLQAAAVPSAVGGPAGSASPPGAPSRVPVPQQAAPPPPAMEQNVSC